LEIPEKKKGKQKKETAAAPGDEEILARSASKEEIRRGDFTLVQPFPWTKWIPVDPAGILQVETPGRTPVVSA
jgi:hypothetical protein